MCVLCVCFVCISIFLLKILDYLYSWQSQEEYLVLSCVLFDSPRYLQNIHLSLAQISIFDFFVLLYLTISGLFLRIN